MINYENIVLSILRGSLKDEKYKIEYSIDADKLFKEADSEGVLPTVYYYLDKECLKQFALPSVLEKYKKTIIIHNTMQLRSNYYISKVLRDLSEQGIEVIVLKGVQIKEYYKRPEFRPMGDCDILVKTDDFDKVRDYFINNGFTEGFLEHEVHRSYELNGISFEAHFKTINESFVYGDYSDFDNKLWKNSISCGDYRIIDINNLLVYLTIHMAVHARYSGFGLRQIYDVALIVNKEKDNINWDYILEEVKKYKLFKFFSGIISVITDELGIELSDYVLQRINVRDEERELLLENIFLSGVHGKKNENIDYLILSRYGANSASHKVVKKIIRLMFPTRGGLGKGYEYTFKYPVLYPFACIHYQFTKGLFKKYGIVENIKNIRSAIELGNMRKELVETFDL